MFDKNSRTSIRNYAGKPLRNSDGKKFMTVKFRIEIDGPKPNGKYERISSYNDVEVKKMSVRLKYHPDSLNLIISGYDNSGNNGYLKGDYDSKQMLNDIYKLCESTMERSIEEKREPHVIADNLFDDVIYSKFHFMDYNIKRFIITSSVKLAECIISESKEKLVEKTKYENPYLDNANSYKQSSSHYTAEDETDYKKNYPYECSDTRTEFSIGFLIIYHLIIFFTWCSFVAQDN